MLFQKIGQNKAFSVTRNQPKNGLKASWTRDFLQFFLPYLMIFHSSAAPSACSTLINHQIWGEKWRKLCSTYLQPISPRYYCGYQRPGFRVLVQLQNPQKKVPCITKSNQINQYQHVISDSTSLKLWIYFLFFVKLFLQIYLDFSLF